MASSRSPSAWRCWAHCCASSRTRSRRSWLAENRQPRAGRIAEGRQRTDVQGALAPVDARALAAIETCQVGLGEDHLAQQVMDEARAPVAQGRQQAAGDPQVGADAGGVLIQLLGQVRRAGQVKPRRRLARW